MTATNGDSHGVPSVPNFVAELIRSARLAYLQTHELARITQSVFLAFPKLMTIAKNKNTVVMAIAYFVNTHRELSAKSLFNSDR
ncbi:hypothetical protein BWQ96_04363 [Gracilariopsis chorda]|uniref:Uncharacterized protein n=1 Tax=Gracilariopsis chorda TaxID=448386 RepID=A0A2V3IUL0_9FLOR|nr:hypothetical protein BWQ96_04363 [Gracilariopsis chorda]|eukprot:PXF45826.1 hypothetical protein BWQ96_04363 [Gracilariopsis chorda]